MHNFKYLLNTYFTIENPYTTILSLTMGIVHSKLNAKPTLKMPPPSPHMHTFFAQVQSITWSLKGTGSNKYMGTFFQNCKRLFPNVYTIFTLDDHIYIYHILIRYLFHAGRIFLDKTFKTLQLNNDASLKIWTICSKLNQNIVHIYQ